MKPSVVAEIEVLRAEVKRLQHEVEDLETRLSESDLVADDPERWNVWPYTWVVAAWDQAVAGYHTANDRLAIWQLERNNLRELRELREQNQAAHSLMKLV